MMTAKEKRRPGWNPGAAHKAHKAHDSNTSYTADFITRTLPDAIRARGLEPPANLAPGRFIRFPGAGRGPADRTAWCHVFEDGRGAVIGDWRGGWSETVQAGRSTLMGAEELARLRRAAAADRAASDRARLAIQQAAAEQVQRIWNAAHPADAQHPYLVRKGVKPHGLRQADNHLLVPLVDLSGMLWNLQTIGADGIKRFQKGGRINGLASLIGDAADRPARMLICEGWATGATLHEQTGAPVLCAMHCGNLRAVAQASRARFPAADIVICGDDDRQTEGNPGRTKATEAAAAVGGKVLIPEFQPGETGTDWNDWHAIRQREVQA